MVRFDLSYMNMQIQINQNNTNRSFGYKVDQDGFFDSNFNKATNIPDNIKIDANHINEFYQISANSNIRDYGHIDIVATLSNIYNDFSKIPSEQRAILAKEELEYREDVYGDFFSFRDEFLDENGNINESGEFFLLFNRIASLNENIIGTHSIRKQVEYDSELRNFIRKNSVYMIEGDNVLSGIMSHDINTSLELLSLTDKEKFKEKWLDALKEYKKS
ncbi:hypothetical protein [Helicobacter sp. WB40]|uniref:hypothetical protein n=1 Tax=Helicobacter sp. WB40 TaxID=3004130 RepID=UPI0022EC018E|nr:hypothetical protein [Helicobacter sp. WB40]MDA3966868.1 hypothetical protein [Helicobacter sp. WB40]